MRSKVRFKILIISCLSIGLCVPFVLSFLSENLFNRINAVDSALKENELIQKNTQLILYELVLTESAGRGYCISGNDLFLANYNKSKKIARAIVREEKVLLNKVGEGETAWKIENLVESKIAFISNVNYVYKKEGPAAAQAIISTGRGQHITDSLISLADELSKSFQKEKDILVSNLDSLKARDKLIDLIGHTTAIVVFLLAAFYIFRNVRNRDNFEKELLDAKEQLVENEKKFMHLFYNNPACSVYVDMDTNRVIDVNESYLKFIGYSREEIINNPNFTKLIKVPENEVLRLRSELRTQGHCDNLELKLTNKSGEEKTIILFATVVKGIDHRMGVIHNIIDVTENRRYASEIIQAKHEAESAAEAKEHFLANMSHEIRTPLNAILGFSNLLGKTTLNEQQEVYLRSIKTSSANLLNITNDILDYSKLESGMFRIEKIGFDLKSLVNSVFTMFTEKAQDKNLEYTYTIDKNIPFYLLGDPTRLTQILVNLLGNAFKFTAEGAITLRIKQLTNNGNSAKVEFEVSDTGIGIDKEDMKKIFERFNQTETKITRQYGGSGLGLTIVKRLIELQDGEIAVRSKKNIGSLFTFTLEYEILKDSTEISSFETSESGPLNLEGKKILLVEDNQLNQLLAKELLISYGLDPTIAENGQIALEILRNDNFDLILMDLQMPVLDGFKTTDFIRNKLYLQVPIIAMSAHVLVAEKEKCLRSGMNDFISKPFKEDEFKAVLRKYLPEVTEKTDAPNNDQTLDENIVDLSSILQISKGNNQFVREMIHLFLQDTPTDVSRIHAAIKSFDYGEIKAASHKLKSSVGIIGLKQEGIDLLQNIETSSSQATGIEWMPKSLQEFEDYFIKAKVFLSNYLNTLQS